MKEYLSSSPIAYTDLVFMAEIDEIMAEYLLKGAKMLAKTCPVCYAPLFEYKGRQFCVVCAESAKETAESGSEMPVDPIPTRTTPADPPKQVIPSSNSDAGISEHQNKADIPSCVDPISDAMVLLCGRIANEPDPARCLLYMQAIREGALSVAALRGNEPHHHRRE
jgi:Uncharacterized Zn-finger containing protein